MTATSKVKIHHIWNGKVLFECEVPIEKNQPYSTCLGMAAQIAVKQRASLERANLQWANFQGAKLPNKSKIPVIHKIHQAVLNAATKPGALNMMSWHKDGYCGTTHCRAGWVCVIAGPEGKTLEDEIGTNAAAALIYAASDPTLERIPDWDATNAKAMADMKRLAKIEAQN